MRITFHSAHTTRTLLCFLCTTTCTEIMFRERRSDQRDRKWLKSEPNSTFRFVLRRGICGWTLLFLDTRARRTTRCCDRSRWSSSSNHGCRCCGYPRLRHRRRRHHGATCQRHALGRSQHRLQHEMVFRDALYGINGNEECRNSVKVQLTPRSCGRLI